MERKRNRLPKSFARRIIKVWFGGVLVPLLIVEAMMLAHTYQINKETVRQGVENDLSQVSEDLTALMNNMNSVSWLLQADSTVGKDLHLYFDETSSVARAELLSYMRDQIANYEVANPLIANITYLYVPKGTTNVVKINSSSLAKGTLPDEEKFSVPVADMTFYGPHMTFQGGGLSVFFSSSDL